MLGIFMALINPVSAIINKVLDLQQKKVDAQTEQEKNQIQEEIDALKARRDVLIAESGDRTNRLMRAWGLAMPAAIIMWKLLVWDKGVGSLVGCSGDTTSAAAIRRLGEEYVRSCMKYTTDALDPNLWWFVGAVAGFYLLTSTRVFKR